MREDKEWCAREKHCCGVPTLFNGSIACANGNDKNRNAQYVSRGTEQGVRGDCLPAHTGLRGSAQYAGTFGLDGGRGGAKGGIIAEPFAVVIDGGASGTGMNGGGGASGTGINGGNAGSAASVLLGFIMM